MATAQKPTLEQALASLRKARAKRDRLDSISRLTYSPYPTDHIFSGVTVAEPDDTGLTYIAASFKRLITGEKRLEVRGVFCAMLMIHSPERARRETVAHYGI